MEPISATIAAIALAKKAVDTARDVKDIGNSLEALFSDHEEQEKKPKKKKGKAKPKTRMQQILRMRSGDEGYDDDTSISAVANKVLEEKKKALALQSLAKEVDKKWGRGTWEEIKKQRRKLIAEREAANQLAKENALKKAKADKIFWAKVLLEGRNVLIILVMVVSLYYFLSWACKGCV
tara:strand:+ start:141 stop:677 length:537 start_codon:yes stop_codon:yes gene_type:complete